VPFESKGLNVHSADVTRKIASPLAGALLFACFFGCRAASTDAYIVPLTPAENQLKFIAMAYGDAESALGAPPKNAEELKPYLKTFGTPNELLVSPNDGQPFVVIWGKKLAGGPTDYKGLFPILAYEKKGSGGNRAVTDIRGRPMTVPVDDFPKLKFIGGHTPSPD
jgi:hypothetical protein